MTRPMETSLYDSKGRNESSTYNTRRHNRESSNAIGLSCFRSNSVKIHDGNQQVAGIFDVSSDEFEAIKKADYKLPLPSFTSRPDIRATSPYFPHDLVDNDWNPLLNDEWMKQFPNLMGGNYRFIRDDDTTDGPFKIRHLITLDHSAPFSGPHTAISIRQGLDKGMFFHIPAALNKYQLRNVHVAIESLWTEPDEKKLELINANKMRLADIPFSLIPNEAWSDIGPPIAPYPISKSSKAPFAGPHTFVYNQGKHLKGWILHVPRYLTEEERRNAENNFKKLTQDPWNWGNGADDSTSLVHDRSMQDIIDLNKATKAQNMMLDLLQDTIGLDFGARDSKDFLIKIPYPIWSGWPQLQEPKEPRALESLIPDQDLVAWRFQYASDHSSDEVQDLDNRVIHVNSSEEAAEKVFAKNLRDRYKVLQENGMIKSDYHESTGRPRSKTYRDSQASRDWGSTRSSLGSDQELGPLPQCRNKGDSSKMTGGELPPRLREPSADASTEMTDLNDKEAPNSSRKHSRGDLEIILDSLDARTISLSGSFESRGSVDTLSLNSDSHGRIYDSFSPVDQQTLPESLLMPQITLYEQFAREILTDLVFNQSQHEQDTERRNRPHYASGEKVRAEESDGLYEKNEKKIPHRKSFSKRVSGRKSVVSHNNGQNDENVREPRHESRATPTKIESTQVHDEPNRKFPSTSTGEGEGCIDTSNCERLSSLSELALLEQIAGNVESYSLQHRFPEGNDTVNRPTLRGLRRLAFFLALSSVAAFKMPLDETLVLPPVILANINTSDI
ncbi:hypothetical protein BS50DRAFT_591089 [Corynespora cassiicola Philippines]|uniref:Uncharacterized protein n=1 Tax=Corynespora cassiicola Philippines TaxID=1448308 RepID=A0A2T2NFB8_CORCC|nr:hypothetical protein BS50DRAFT_591089 [Corynespora cassiicola Philippines]